MNDVQKARKDFLLKSLVTQYNAGLSFSNLVNKCQSGFSASGKAGAQLSLWETQVRIAGIRRGLDLLDNYLKTQDGYDEGVSLADTVGKQIGAETNQFKSTQNASVEKEDVFDHKGKRVQEDKEES